MAADRRGSNQDLTQRPAASPERAAESPSAAPSAWANLLGLGWLSFRYNFLGVMSDGDRAQVVARERRYENGRLEAQDFEGTLQGPAAAQLAERIAHTGQRLFVETTRVALGAFQGAGRLMQGALEFQRLMLGPLAASRDEDKPK